MGDDAGDRCSFRLLYIQRYIHAFLRTCAIKLPVRLTGYC